MFNTYLRIQSVCLLCMLISLKCSAIAEDSIPQKDLQRLRNWVQRDRSSLIALDKFGEQLLKRYEKPEQRGEIYYYLAHHHAQGGLAFPQRVIEYAKKSLDYPISSTQKLRLYVYWGDGLRVANRKKPFPEGRKEAVIPYLRGLKVLERFKLPENSPQLPSQPIVDPGPGATIEEQRRADEAYNAREKVKFAREMLMHRTVLQGQIVSLYGRAPVATEELKEMATNILGEGKELDRLMAAVNERVAKLPPEARQTMTPIEAAVPPMSSKYLYLSIAAVAGTTVAMGFLIISRWRRAKRVA